MRLIRRAPILAVILAVIGMPMLSPVAFAEVICGEDVSPAEASPDAMSSMPVPDATFPDDGGTLTIFAAASLTDVFAEMETRLEEDHPELDVSVETAGSQTIVTQLQQGAQADVLATANMRWMDTAVDSGLVEGEPILFTGNRLVIVAPEGNPAGIESVDDLAGDDLSLILAGPDVPAGSYAHRAFCNYVADGDAPDGFIDAINANLVSEETDVRNVLAKIQLGEADAGVVYASDAAAAINAGTPLEVVEFPATVPTSADYPIAALSEGNPDLANAFIAYVMSDEGQAILDEYGFTPAG